MRVATSALLVAAAALLGCGPPSVPAHPTWVDVRPILAGECTHCHGATARATGDGFRFDFYDMQPETCAEATEVLGEGFPLGAARGDEIWNAITAPAERPNQRPAMPPAPAPYLASWEWQTIRRWLDDGAPKGDAPAGNHAPQISLGDLPETADAGFDLSLLVEDADSDPVVGRLTIGDRANGYRAFDHTGAFASHVDTSTWPAGAHPITTVLCDGWTAVPYALGAVTVAHAAPPAANR